MSNIFSSLAYAGTGTVGTVTLLEATGNTPVTDKQQIVALAGSILFQAVLLGFKELKKYLAKKKAVKELIKAEQPTPVLETELPKS